MAKIPFDIKYRPQIESGEYKVFAHEHEEQEARIVCWDNKGEYPIVALVDNEPEKFDKHGRVPGGNRGGEFSLFIITPESELTEFEDGLRQICEEAVTEAAVFPDRTSEDFAKTHSAKLLALAREELFANDAVLKEYAEVARERGKAEALKDLPRWKKCADCTPKPKYSNEWIFSIDSENVTRESAFVHKGYFLPLDGLEKLPGFNE